METLLRAKRAAKVRLTRVYNMINNGPPTKPEEATAQLATLNEAFKNLESVFENIFRISDDIAYEEEADAVYANYDEVRKKLLFPTERLQSARSSSSLESINPHTAPHLPPLHLPTFAGDRQEFVSFLAKFDNAVDSQPISSARKLQYLLGCLKGKAQKLCAHLEISDHNYEVTRRLLEKKFKNKRKLVFQLVDNIFNHPLVTSNQELEGFLDVLNGSYYALAAEGAPIEDGNVLFCSQMLKKLTPELRAEFKEKIGPNLPTAKEFLNFVEGKCITFDEEDTSPKIQHAVKKSEPAIKKDERKMPLCPVCDRPHLAISCSKFTVLTIQERRDLIKKKKLCFNCMQPNHTANTCPSSNCKKCNQKHHTLLHINENFNGHCDVDEGILLATANVPVEGANGEVHFLRALLDTGSNATLITENAAKQLKNKYKLANEECTTLGGLVSIKKKIDLKLLPESDNIMTTANVVDSISTIPSKRFHIEGWKTLQKLDLADPNFHEPRPVDLLLSSSVVFQLLLPEKINGKNGQPDAWKTKVGYILVGGKQKQTQPKMIHNVMLKEDLNQLWALEEPTAQAATPEDDLCEKLFRETTIRKPDGSYEVTMPLKSLSEVQPNKSSAFRRLQSLEKKFIKDSDLHENYIEQMKDYLKTGHLQPAGPSSHSVFYMPHHAVMKPTSTTTKCRVVFDASSGGNTSLNHAMMKGPVIQDDLVSILTRFRRHPVALSGDISKMYRQIHVNPEQWDLQRVLWRSSIAERVDEYTMTRLTFGIKAAPFLATRVLKQLALDESEKFPETSQIVLRDFYMDDLMTGADTVTAAVKLQEELTDLLSGGGFQLQKWASNYAPLQEDDQLRSVQHREFVSTLGIHWDQVNDAFTFTVDCTTPARTKRAVLSHAARLFDPLGWLTPTTIFAKMFLQDLWRTKLSWDDNLPDSLQNTWTEYEEQLKELNSISIPRHLGSFKNSKLTLVGFADASCKAYAACVYLRCLNESSITSRLITSKSKVAPLKATTIPKLELQAALLLKRLICKVKSSLRLEEAETFLYTDSTIVLSWIKAPCYTWKTFVANRVAEIQEGTTPETWRHVSSEENPADIATRAAMPTQLQSSELWWSGPYWLQLPNLPNPAMILPPISNSDLQVYLINKKSTISDEIISDCSSLVRLCRRIALIRRFIRKCQKKPSDEGFITAREFDEALMTAVKITQNKYFSAEIKQLQGEKTLPKESELKTLVPFIDANDLIRVSGRLENSDLPYDAKHPIIIPKQSHFAQLLVRWYHAKNLHASTTLLLATIRSRFWITGGRRTVKNLIHRCIICHRHRAKAAEQLMGQLPVSRVRPARPFSYVGVDYAGPFNMKPNLPRSTTRLKGYIAVFVCMATKAIHLEVVSEMSAQAFIAALNRFCARRGTCNTIFSDNGTNFVGANNILSEFVDIINQEVPSQLAERGISWKFIPPHAPHFGGLWEAGVKSVKYHLSRTIANAVYNYEELTTILTQIEACLNSRPICPMSDDPEDLSPLTPGHFLIGAPLTSPPDVDLTGEKITHLNRWQLLQRTSQEFWKRWTTEYLNRLQQRPKWMDAQPDIKEGNLVVILDEQLPPRQWKLGRVQTIHPGKDNKVRVVTLKTEKGLVERPITKISLLPL